ncbi:putative holin [Pectobacterium brasiliense]|uniref:putative holin n=1 Tax=Pectobacterium brasiliense TaxID=180957 RepID=UPI0032EB77A1
MSLIHKVFPQRLRNWIVLAVILLIVIALVSPAQLSITVYKLSLVSVAVVLGYHLDRALFPYASPGSYLIDDWKSTQGKPVLGVGGRNEPEYPIATGYLIQALQAEADEALMLDPQCATDFSSNKEKDNIVFSFRRNCGVESQPLP